VLNHYQIIGEPQEINLQNKSCYCVRI